MIVGSEGTLAVILEARLNLVRLPKEKAVLVVQFHELLDALEATPLILRHKPSAVEVMDQLHPGPHASQSRICSGLRETFVEGEPGALALHRVLCRYEGRSPPRLAALEAELTSRVMAIASTMRRKRRNRLASGVFANPRWDSP